MEHLISLPEECWELALNQYAFVPANVAYRWEWYKHAAEPINFYEKVASDLQLDGSESILDIGCSDGRGLNTMIVDGAQHGQLVGVDIDPAVLGLHKLLGNNNNNIDYSVANAQRLPFASESFDITTSLFMLYHVPDPEAGLKEMDRVTKTGGKLVIATSGKNNKFRHREFEQAIARYTGTQAPPTFSETFDYDIADNLLRKYYQNIQLFKQETTAQFTEDDIEDYFNSLLSMKGSFTPPTMKYSEIKKAFGAVVLPIITSEIQKQGYFEDTIERYSFICTK